MPSPYLRLAAIVVSLLACCETFASPAPTVSSADVLEAIRSFEGNLPSNLALSGKSAKDSTAQLAKAANTIVDFAINSDSVVIDMGPDSVTWCDVKKGVNGMAHSGERGLLFGAYLSGSIKAQLTSGKTDPNPYAGWIAALRLYKTLKARDNVQIAELDLLAAKQQDATLESYAAEAAKRSVARLEANYHGQRPVTLALAH